MRRTKKSVPWSLSELESYGIRRLAAILRKAETLPGLWPSGRGPRPRPRRWSVDLRCVGSVMMARLNGKYRGKPVSTDVLSFESPPVFVVQGILGELVVCGPKVRRQALEHGHSERVELDVLLVHGLLHLMGWDHERSPAEALLMARRERKLLRALSAGQGLIDRTH